MEWTEKNNKATINQLLDFYAGLLAVYRNFVDENLDADLPTKLKTLQTLKSIATTIDSLLKRWSLVHQGWHTNPRLAKADAEAKTLHAEKVDLEGAPLEAFFQVVQHYGPSMKEILWSLPKPLKPPSDEFGVWAYDATAQELYPPDRETPISEAEARKRLIKRKSSTPATLILFG